MENQQDNPPELEPVASTNENPEISDAEQFGRHNIRFLKFAGVRPRHISAEFPSYNPDRDFVQCTRIVNNVINMLITTKLDWWKEITDKLGIEFETPCETGRKLSPELKEAVDAVVHFVNQAYGKIGEDSYIEDPHKYVSIEQAISTLFKTNKGGLLIVLAMLGSELLDMLFFGARQDRLIGREGKFTMGDLIDTLPVFSTAVRDGVDPETRATEALETVVRAALLCGMTGAQIGMVVDQAVVGTLKQ